MIIKNTGKRVNRMAHKIIAVKEDMDVLSWTRVIELSKLIQIEEDKEIRHELAEEMRMLAQLHLSVFGRMGITLPEGGTRTLASGMEVERGLEASSDMNLNLNQSQPLPSQGMYAPQTPSNFNQLCPSISGPFPAQGVSMPPSVSKTFPAQNPSLSPSASGSFAPLNSDSRGFAVAAGGDSVPPFVNQESASGSVLNLDSVTSGFTPNISGPVFFDSQVPVDNRQSVSQSVPYAVSAAAPFLNQDAHNQDTQSVGVSTLSASQPFSAQASIASVSLSGQSNSQEAFRFGGRGVETYAQSPSSAEVPSVAGAHTPSFSKPSLKTDFPQKQTNTDDYLVQMKARMEALREQVQLLNEAVAVSDADDCFDEQVQGVKMASESVTDCLVETGVSRITNKPSDMFIGTGISPQYDVEKAASVGFSSSPLSSSATMPSSSFSVGASTPSNEGYQAFSATGSGMPVTEVNMTSCYSNAPIAPAVLGNSGSASPSIAPAPLLASTPSISGSVPLVTMSEAASIPLPDTDPLETVYTSAVGEIVEENSLVEPRLFSQEDAGERGQFDLSQFNTLYQSKDGNLCLFQDGEGHLVAVDANKLV